MSYSARGGFEGFGSVWGNIGDASDIEVYDNGSGTFQVYVVSDDWSLVNLTLTSTAGATVNFDGTFSNTAPTGTLEYRLSEDYYTEKASNFPCFMAFNTFDVDLVSNSYTTVVFNAEDYDLGNDYNITKGVFTAPVTGIYDFNAQLTIVNHTDDSPRFSLRLNTSQGRNYHAHWDLNEGQYEGGTMEPHSVFKLNAQIQMQEGETIRLEYFQSDVSFGDIDANSYSQGTANSFFSGRLVVRTQ